MKKAFLVLVLLAILLLNSGCATILGGIIGHQSGEMCAGLAIGAALDFGDDIARGIAQASANVKREFQQNSELDSNQGRIVLPGVAFTVGRMLRVKNQLKNKMEQSDWISEISKKTAKTGWFCKDRFSETWHCTTSKGHPFTMKIQYEQDEDPEITVNVPPESSAERPKVTLEIYSWLEEISAGG